MVNRTADKSQPDTVAPQISKSFGFKAIDPDDKQAKVGEVFSSVANRYDLMNDLMSGYLHRAWRDAMVSSLAPPRTGPARWKILDMAGGTGDIALRIAERSNAFADIIVADINESMLEVGKERIKKTKYGSCISFKTANAETLDYQDNQFDAYTIAFGIRNVTHIDRALKEAFRVLRPGGKFLCLEFSQADLPVFDKIYEAYSFYGIPALGRIMTGDEDAYRYLVESIRMFPNPVKFAQMVEDAGFSQVAVRKYSGGVAALHSGIKI